ncbi:hypothetical protein Thena_0883 [Thermodesulfobium narugense DSM 14796]|uniref:Uncharacterized protein n=1 Tax=Thermodesulfobium narugense DSM 14796 TaxID=747365 RepID=M1E4T3_9BACT|nr:hypothetical protein [Thermodesulfobium narugense]AEE14512.1 hypothetical protein Thena_0883 [Thermodesulfobium narugense DSM 14796]
MVKKTEAKYKIEFGLKNLFVGNLSLWHDFLDDFFKEQNISVVEVSTPEELKNNFTSISLFAGEYVYFKVFEITKELAKLLLEIKVSEDKKLFAVCEKVNAMTLKGLENKGIKVFKEDFNFVTNALENFFSKYNFKLDKKLAREMYAGYEKDYEWTKNELIKLFLGSSSPILESKKIWDISKLFFEGEKIKDLSIFNVKSDEVFVLIEVLKRDLIFAYFNLKYHNLLKPDPGKIWQLKHVLNTKLTLERIAKVLIRVIKTEGQLKSGLLSNDDSLQLILKILFSDSEIC